jgi:hypothetical protein
MINCELQPDGSYFISGLSLSDLEMFEEGIHFIFNQSRKEEHRHYRHQAIELVKPITDILDKNLPTANELTLF